jgi:hypothetical protein
MLLLLDLFNQLSDHGSVNQLYNDNYTKIAFDRELETPLPDYNELIRLG